MIRRLCRYLSKWFGQYCVPNQEEMVRNIILGVTSLGLSPEDKAYLAPINGVCGPFVITGNSLPIFRYLVFDKEIRQFVRIKVEISKPDRITYQGTIESESIAPELHGKIHPVADRYKRPFQNMCKHIYHYFPLCRIPL
jgi:hypothetical protein